MKYKNKTFSILGDSISTFEGFVPNGYDVFYMLYNQERADLLDWRDTWWGQVITHFDGTLLKNDSWSGSLVSDKYDYPRVSCGYTDERTGNLSLDGQDPDVIFVFIGTNDCGWRVQPASEDKDDMSVFENAYSAMLDKLKKNYPKAEIWCLTVCITTISGYANMICASETRLADEEVYVDIIKHLAEEKGCHVIDLHDGSLTVDTIEGLHPTKVGMTAIANKIIASMEAE